MRFGEPHVAAITASMRHAEFISTDLAKIKPPMIRRFMLSAEADRFNESLLRHRPKQVILSAAKARGRRTQKTAQQNAKPTTKKQKQHTNKKQKTNQNPTTQSGHRVSQIPVFGKWRG